MPLNTDSSLSRGEPFTPQLDRVARLVFSSSGIVDALHSLSWARFPRFLCSLVTVITTCHHFLSHPYRIRTYLRETKLVYIRSAFLFHSDENDSL